MLTTSKLGRSLREVAIAEAMLQSVSGRYRQAAGGAIESTAWLMIREDTGAGRSLESWSSPLLGAVVRAPAAVAGIRSAFEYRLDAISRKVDDAQELVAGRTVALDAIPHGWIGGDGEFHDFG